MSRLVRVYGPWPMMRPLEIKPGILRRLGLRRSLFVTQGELAKAHFARRNVKVVRSSP